MTDDEEDIQRRFVKNDGDKPRTDLLPVDALEEVAKVLGHGAEKYAPNNWRKVDDRMRFYGAAMRHLFAYHRGEDTDPDSGLPHLSHAACSVLFLLECELRGHGADTRQKRETP